jgi:uncharacterized protein (UPF0218 family)
MEHDEVVITSDNQVGTKNNLYRVFAGRVTIPEFEVFSSPKIHISDIKTRRFNVIDRVVQKARQEIMNQEDAAIFAALDAAGKK